MALHKHPRSPRENVGDVCYDAEYFRILQRLRHAGTHCRREVHPYPQSPLSGKAGYDPDSHEYTEKEFNDIVKFMDEMAPKLMQLRGLSKEIDLTKGFRPWMQGPCK